jgi:hypothetical protein
MGQRYSIAGRAATSGGGPRARQVLETKGFFGILSDGNDANLALDAYMPGPKRTF